MRGTRSFHRFVVVIVVALLRPALTHPQGGIIITESAAPITWVSVDATGSATTIAPGVITTQGHRTTLATAPASLAATGTYILSPSGHASTYTGPAPVATATGKGGSIAGVFPACDANAGAGPVEPFCLPLPGSQLHPGITYYISWSPSYFPPNLTVSLQVFYNASSPTSTAGATSPPIPAAQGFFPWTVPPDFFSGRPNKHTYPDPYEVAFALTYEDSLQLDGEGAAFGPTVYITSGGGGGSVSPGGGAGGTHAAIIAVPVTIAAVLALLAAFCVASWRRTGHLPLIGGLAALVKAGRTKRRSRGYGVRQSRSERVGSSSVSASGGAAGGDKKSETNVQDIQLTDRDSWSPTAGGGRNVFREEVERQARLG